MVRIEKDFEAPNDKKGMVIKRKKVDWERIRKSKGNNKVTGLLINILPNEIFYRIGEYKNSHELWTKLISFMKNHHQHKKMRS